MTEQQTENAAPLVKIFGRLGRRKAIRSAISCNAARCHSSGSNFRATSRRAPWECSTHGCERPAGRPLERDPFFLETSRPGVYAAGDVPHGSIKRFASAVGEGAMAVTFAHRTCLTHDDCVSITPPRPPHRTVRRE